jgi:hypothetical protein
MRSPPRLMRKGKPRMGIPRRLHQHLAAPFVVRAGLVAGGHHRRVVAKRQPQHQGGHHELHDPKRYKHNPKRHPFRCYYRDPRSQAALGLSHLARGQNEGEERITAPDAGLHNIQSRCHCLLWCVDRGPSRLIRPRLRGGFPVFPSDVWCWLLAVILDGSSRLLSDATRGRGRVSWRVLPSLVHGVRPCVGGSHHEQAPGRC